MKRPARENFNLSKLKVKKEGIVYIEHTIAVTDGEEIHAINCKDEFTFMPHDDMINKLSELKEALAMVYGYYEFNTIAQSKPFQGTPSQKDYLKKTYERVLDSIKVTGISLGGNIEKQSLVITGTKKLGTGRVAAINSDKMTEEQDVYGCEEKAFEVVKELINEAYAYIYEDKHFDDGQQALPFKQDN